MDVFSLSDEDLLFQLRQHNIECGPILDSTRRIYQKKLQKVLMGGGAAPSSSADTLPVEDISDYEEEEEEPEPEPAPVTRQTRTMERREVRQRVTREPAPPPEEYTDYTRQRNITRDEPRPQHTSYTSTSRTVTSSSSSSLSSRPQGKSAPASAADIVTQAEEPQETPKKGGLSIWIQLIIVLIVAFLIFLVFQNMEPAAKAPPRQLGADEEV